MVRLSCQQDIPKISNQEEGNAPQLTVGREFYLTCEGEIPKDLKIEGLKLKWKGQEDPLFALKLLGYELRNAHVADLRMTSYSPGVHTFEELILTDSVQEVDLGSQKIQVLSVLGQQNEKPSLYGPLGPQELPLPFIFWQAIMVFVGLLVILLVLQFFRFKTRRRILAEVRKYENPRLTPSQQVYRGVQKLKRAYNFYHQIDGGRSSLVPGDSLQQDLVSALKSLNECLRIYLVQTFKVPGMSAQVSPLMKMMKKKLPTGEFKSLQELTLEMDLCFKKSGSLTRRDLIQLTEQLQKWVDSEESRARLSGGGQ